MRHLHAYKWEDVLEEYVPRTFIGLDLIRKEEEAKKKAHDKASRRAKRGKR